MSDHVSRLVEQRQLRRGVLQLLAEPLPDDARAQFLDDAEADLNRQLPAPGRAHMRMYLKSVD